MSKIRRMPAPEEASTAQSSTIKAPTIASRFVARLGTPAFGAAVEVGELVEVGIEAGKVATIAAAGVGSDGAADLSRFVLFPRFVEAHVHLDKVLLGSKWYEHTGGGSIPELVAAESRFLAGPDVEPVAVRAARLIERLVGNGVGTIRSHVDISAASGLTHLVPLLELRERYHDVVDLSFVAFPQEGILASPGTAELLDEALRLGADVVGGLDPVGFDGDRDAHLDTVFGLAMRHGKPIDLHVHEFADLGADTLFDIAARTQASGLGGRVAVSHAYCLAMLEDARLGLLLDTLARAGVAIISSVPGMGWCPPFDKLRAAGVTVAFASDNIRDRWAPFGKADPLERAHMAAYMSGWWGDDELLGSLEGVGADAARAIGREPPSLASGARADFVLVPALCAQEALVEQPSGRIVVVEGSVIAGSGVSGSELSRPVGA